MVTRDLFRNLTTCEGDRSDLQQYLSCHRIPPSLRCVGKYDSVMSDIGWRRRMPRTSRPITVTLGELQERVEARVKSGAYASASEVMRAAVRALDREDAALSAWLRRRVDEAFADPRPSISARDVFKRLRKHH